MFVYIGISRGAGGVNVVRVRIVTTTLRKTTNYGVLDDQTISLRSFGVVENSNYADPYNVVGLGREVALMAMSKGPRE